MGDLGIDRRVILKILKKLGVRLGSRFKSE
jgi:hypothetical protein